MTDNDKIRLAAKLCGFVPSAGQINPVRRFTCTFENLKDFVALIKRQELSVAFPNLGDGDSKFLAQLQATETDVAAEQPKGAEGT